MSVAGNELRFEATDLEAFARDVFVTCGLGREQAAQSADVMVAADVRGVPSHGIGRLWRYVNGLKSGLMLVDAQPEVVVDTPGSLVVDAHGGMGFPISVDKMLRDLRRSPPAEGAQRVYFAGQKEFEHEAEVRQSGVPLYKETVASLAKISREVGVPLPEEKRA